PHHVLVRHQHDAPAAQRKRYRKRGMGRPGKRRRPVEARDELRSAQVLNVENDEPAVPVAHIEPIALAHGMVAAMCRALPARSLAAGCPLSRHPPLADEPGPRRILEVDNADDVAEIAVHFRRAVDVAPVEGEAMHAAAGEARDVFRVGWAADVVDLEAAAKVRVLAADREDLAIARDHAVLDPYLVRERAVGNGDLCEFARLGRIADVDDARSMRGRDVADIGNALAHHHLPPAETIEVADDLESVAAPAVHAL